MNRTYWTAIGILSFAAIISLILWLTGFPPPWDLEKGQTVSTIRQLLTTPFFIVGVGTLLTIPVAFAKKNYLAEAGKANMPAIIGVLFIPLITLSLQILMPLILYDVINKNMANTIFFCITALFFLSIGNYIVTAEPNSNFGLRNKWTLSDPIIWARTHRFFGRSLVIVTLLCLPLGFITNSKQATYILIAVILSLKLITLFYARALSQKTA